MLDSSDPGSRQCGMSAPDRIVAHFAEQAGHCRALGSPFTAELLECIAALLHGDAAWTQPLRAWPGDPKADALALRVAGALHRAVLQGGDAELAALYAARRTDEAVLAAALARHADLLRLYLQSPPQTNDPQRSAVLLGGFRCIAAACPGLPLHGREIGASAGLNLSWDSYAYDFGTWRHGDSAGAPLTLRADWQGEAPPNAAISVASRAGCDIAPLRAADAAHRQRLLSYIWADQPQRLQRVAAALDHAQAQGIMVEPIAAGDFVARELAERPPAGVTVLYHSIVWQYVGADEQQRITALMQAAGAIATPAAPLAWLRLEPGVARDGADLTLTLWPGTGTGTTQRLAAGDFHGRWVRWSD
jgi:hypothetical protein